jgi:hypothetical protein
MDEGVGMSIEELGKKADAAEILVLRAFSITNEAAGRMRIAEQELVIAREDYYVAYGLYLKASEDFSQSRIAYLEARKKES